MKLNKFFGNFSAILAASLFGAAIVATRVVVQDIPPLSLAVLRFAQGGLLLYLYLFIGAKNLLKVNPIDLPYLILLGAILFAIFPVTFNIGIKYTPASRAALMISTMPLWSALLARTIVKERLTLRQIIGIGITLAGVGIVLSEKGLFRWQGITLELLGDGLMLLTAFCGALYGVLAKRMLARYSALTVTTYAMIFGTLLLSPALYFEGLSKTLIHIDGKTIALILFLGVFCGALGFFLWTFALSRLSPTQVAVYANANPMVAIILGVILLGENLSTAFIAGFGILVVGILFVNWPTRNQVKAGFSKGSFKKNKFRLLSDNRLGER